MKSRTFTSTLAFVACLFIPISLFAQDPLLVPSDGPALNAVIAGDTLADGSQAHAVYQLERDALYTLTNSVVTDGFDATIEAEEGEGTPPVVMMGADESGEEYAGSLFKFDSDFTLSGIQVYGCWGPQAARGWHDLLVPGGNDLTITIDNCIFDYADGDVIQNWSGFTNHSIFVTNSLFRMSGGVNTGDPWQGFGPLYVDSPVEMLYVENNTIVDCVAPWLVFENANLENFWFNHNTIVSHAQFLTRHEYHINSLFMNNLFVDVNFMGQDEDLRIGQDYDGLPYGVITVDTPDGWEGFPANDERVVLFSNNNNYVSQPIKDWWETAKVDFDTSGFQVTDYTKGDNGLLNSRSVTMMADDATYPYFLWSDAVSVYTMDPGFTGYTADYPEMVKFARNIMGDPQGDSEWASHPQGNILIPLARDFQYFDYSNTTLQQAGYMGYPVGDLNWWPDEKTAWEADATKESYDDILAQIKAGTFTFPSAVGIEEKYMDGEISGLPRIQIYPNPAHSSVTMAFSLAESDYVSLKIYNISGKEVVNIVNRIYGEGKHFTILNTENLPNGTYFCQLKAGNDVLIRKLMILK